MSNLAKGSIVGKFENFSGVINCITIVDNYALIAPQGDGVHWCDINKLKKLFHSPRDVSISAITSLNNNNYVFSDLQGGVHLMDKRTPLKAISSVRAGNTVHALCTKGSLAFAAC